MKKVLFFTISIVYSLIYKHNTIIMAITRRSFLKKTSYAVATGLTLPQYLKSATPGISANDRISVALIGCRSMGWSNLSTFLQSDDVRCMAACTIETGSLCAKYTHLGNIAARMSGTSLRYDDRNKSFNIAEANKYIKPRYRAPWMFPQI